MKYQKSKNLLDTTSDTIPRFIIKNGLEFMISQVFLKIDINQVNK